MRGKAIRGAGTIVFVAIALGGIYSGIRTFQLKRIALGRIEALETELIEAQSALGRAEDYNNQIGNELEKIRVERDALDREFGNIRDSVQEFRERIDAGADLIDESIGLIDAIISGIMGLENPGGSR